MQIEKQHLPECGPPGAGLDIPSLAAPNLFLSLQ